MNSGLEHFLTPRGVAIIGASKTPSKLGNGIARNLIGSGYPGAIYLVGQKAGELMGRRLYGSIAEVEDPVDLAVIAVPAEAVPSTIHDCGERGIDSAIIVTAGFREIGAEGAALERHCLEAARMAGVRLMGPNCIGTINTGLPLDTTFLRPPMPPRGNIAFLSHSGAFCAAIVDWSRQQGFGFSEIVSLGNQADITETDMLPVVAESPNTKVIVMYLEGIGDGARFVEAAGAANQHVPIVALKVGNSKAGQKAAASHTAALATSDVAFDAAFARAGVLRAQTAEQMFDWARALDLCPLPAGRRVAILTDAGGPGVIAADAIDRHAMELAVLSNDTQAGLRRRLPAAASIGNPVDMLASASPADYAHCLSLLLGDSAVDAVLVILPPPPMYEAQEVAASIVPLIKSSAKPVVVALLGAQHTASALAFFRSHAIATFPFPERGISALSALAARGRWLRGPSSAGVPARPFPIQDTAKPGIDALLSVYGISTPSAAIARSPDEAAAMAANLGFPVVLKISSPQISHKSDVAGVLTGVSSAEAARTGYTQVMNSVQRHLPSASIDGVLIQQQVAGGQEVIVGIVHDRSFGALVMFGAGGIEAEAARDVAFDLAPLNERQADELIAKTWAGRRLEGYRNIEGVDRPAARDALVRLSWLATDHPEIKEIEINPLRVMEKGALALDVRATIRS